MRTQRGVRPTSRPRERATGVAPAADAAAAAHAPRLRAALRRSRGHPRAAHIYPGRRRQPPPRVRRRRRRRRAARPDCGAQRARGPRAARGASRPAAARRLGRRDDRRAPVRRPDALLDAPRTPGAALRPTTGSRPSRTTRASASGSRARTVGRGRVVGARAGGRRGRRPTAPRSREGNRAYEERFGYIYIVCATGRTADEMLAACTSASRTTRRRAPRRRRGAAEDHAPPPGELLANDEPITTHVLDTARGRPAAARCGALVLRAARGTPWVDVARAATTDADGRVAATADGEARRRRGYRLTFDTGAYFARRQPTFYPGVAFDSSCATRAHHHVPLSSARSATRRIAAAKGDRLTSASDVGERRIMNINEWLNLLFRWTHVFAAILWVGSTYYFTWLDGADAPAAKGRQAARARRLDGAQRRLLQRQSSRRRSACAPGELHWFRYESLITWISGLRAARPSSITTAG